LERLLPASRFVDFPFGLDRGKISAMISIRIDHKLRVVWSQLPPEVIDLIVAALTIPNIERQKAMEQDLWGWRQMPETINLWNWCLASDGDRPYSYLVMPRGFLPNLTFGLDELDIPYEFDDRRVFEAIPAWGEKISLYPWQVPAVEAIIRNTDGIWKAPAGSGKTVGVLEAIRRLNCPSVVLVNTKDILYQWRDRAKEFLGSDFPVGLIGDGHFEISDFLTIATAQTLHRRFDRLERDGFFEQFSFLCLDECHHATAETYNNIVDRFECRHRIGVSATPDKTGDFALATNVLGPIFHETKREDVDSIVKPCVFKISTNFSFEYQGRKGRRPSNYPQLLKNLVWDVGRNVLIAKSIMLNSEGHTLVVSKRLQHLENLIERLQLLGYPHLMLKMTGQESAEARGDVIEYATKHPCAIFSTLADEALDIPRLDRLFLVFPQRNTGLIEQQVGRIARSHPDKSEAKVFDFADMKVGPLEVQWRIRRIQVYQQYGYPVTTVMASDILKFEG
jgi:superfamily II DNA or RNA helicase